MSRWTSTVVGLHLTLESPPLPGALIGENRQLVTYEPVEFEKQPVEVVQDDSMQLTNHSRGNYEIYSNLTKEDPEDVNM